MSNINQGKLDKTRTKELQNLLDESIFFTEYCGTVKDETLNINFIGKNTIFFKKRPFSPLPI